MMGDKEIQLHRVQNRGIRIRQLTTTTISFVGGELDSDSSPQSTAASR